MATPNLLEIVAETTLSTFTAFKVHVSNIYGGILKIKVIHVGTKPFTVFPKL
jgi:hypothetical protein